MANIVLFDADQKRLEFTAHCIRRHLVRCCSDPVLAFELSTRSDISLMLLDWNGGKALELIEGIRGYSPQGKVLPFVLIHDIDLTEEADVETFFRRVYDRGIFSTVNRDSPRQFRICLNECLVHALFTAWLFRLGPPEFPFDPRLTKPNAYSRLYYRSPLVTFVKAVGGWEALRNAFDWRIFQNDPYALDEIIERLFRWGRILRQSERFPLTAFFLPHDPEAYEGGEPERDVLQALANAVPLSKSFSAN